jgi:Mobilization protein NikA
VREHVIGFRVDWNEYREIERQAEKRGEEVSEWCRNLVLSESGKDFGMTASERILLEELAILRHLLGRQLKEALTPEEFAKIRREVDQKYPEWGRHLIEKRAGVKAYVPDPADETG